MRVLFILLFFLLSNLNAKDYKVDSTAKLKTNTIEIDTFYKSTTAELEVRWTDSNGEFGLGKCNAHVLSKKNEEIIDAYCENLDIGDKFWTFNKKFIRNKQVQNYLYKWHRKYKKLIGKKCNYAVRYFDNKNLFFKQICKFS